MEVGRRYIDDALNQTTGDVRTIADVMVSHAEGSLHHWLNVTLAVGGALVVLGVVVAMLGALRAERLPIVRHRNSNISADLNAACLLSAAPAWPPSMFS